MRCSFVLLALGLAGCSSGTPPASTAPADTAPLGTAADKAVSATTAPSPAPATAKPVSWPAPFTPAAGSLCRRVAARGATIRMRPAADAAQFGQLTVGDQVRLAARTADGWVGFSPGSAQAANVGVFRLRWVRATEAFAPGDSCAQLPLVIAPPAGCLLMAARALPVRAQPAATAPLLSTIPAGSYAQIARATKPGTWVAVVVPGQRAPGYVAGADANFSGPCQ